ncbi:MAG: flippase activity-associated protein Agl23 [Chloroflexota bacterium]
MAENAMVREAASAPSPLDRPVAALLQLNWENVAWVVILLLAVITRFYDLGARAMSHDESLHALYSFYLYDHGDYTHNPMMHGPFLFHANAFAYFLFGDNDTTARIVPVLFGLALIWVARWFRIYIGRWGALLAGILILISPSLLYHSRYIRNDIYIALLTTTWIYSSFRYLDTRERKYLLGVTLSMAFGFIAKENHFMSGAIIGAFFAGLALWQAIPGGKMSNLFKSPSADLAVLMLTLILPFTAPFGHLLLDWDPLATATTTDLLRSTGLVGAMTLVAVALAFFWFAVARQDYDDAELPPQKEGGDETEALGESAGESRRWPLPPTIAYWGGLMGIFWAIQVLFFTTFLTNTREGLASGIVGSLGYWIEQQEVARGGQPWFYYPMIGSIYEFLPMILSGVGIVVIGWYLMRNWEWDPTPANDLPDEVRPFVEVGKKKAKNGKDKSNTGNGNTGKESIEKANKKEVQDERKRISDHLSGNRLYFVVFCIWWTLGSWLAYTIAGEKMPWLLTHMALPMCFLGGWYLGRLINRVDWAAARAKQGLWLMGVTPALLFLVALLVRSIADSDRTTDALADRMQAILAIVVIAVLVYLAERWRQSVGWATAGRLLAIGFVAILAVLTVRFSVLLTYINYDMATEYLIYAHGGPDLKRALSEIDHLSERTVGGRNIAVAYDNDSSWPLSWYMRLYPNSKFYGENPSSDAMASPVIIVGNKNYEKVHPYVVRDYVKRSYIQVWWPDQGYFFFTWDKFKETVTSWDKFERVLQILFYRRHRADGIYVSQDANAWRDLTQWPQRHDFEMWVRRDIAAEIWDLGVAPVAEDPNNICVQSRDRETDLSAVAIHSGTFGDLNLTTPRDVAVNPVTGERVIADSGNHRLVMLDQAGNLVRTIGSQCNLGSGADGGCVDPDGDGPLALGDGQFNEPWGVAVDDAGQIYVSDTWNGRIQVFDSEGNFQTKWGTFGSTNGELGDHLTLFGPRGIAIDQGGNLLIADTGNKRILQFTSDGQFITQIGGGGVIGGRFEEPVSVAVDRNLGNVYVADAWNRRIQKLSANLEFEQEFPICGWESQQIYHKPYVAVAPNGDVYASDPELAQIYIYTNDGQLKNVFGRPGRENNQFVMPTGLIGDPTTNSVLVADADNNRIMAFPAVP